MAEYDTAALVGVGLIGGSLALAHPGGGRARQGGGVGGAWRGGLRDAGGEAAVAQWESPRAGPRSVGSHPIAGDHRTGPQHARADLFDGHTVVVTPEDDTPPALVERIRAFWRSLGA